MSIPLKITYRDIEPTEAIDNRIRTKAEKLERFFDKIISCHIVVEIPQKHKGENHKHHAVHYNVEIELKVPGKLLVVNRQPNTDLYASIRDAFDAMVRQLEDYARALHREVKTHDFPREGRIVRLLDGYGFIEDNSGEEYYFDKYNLTQADFDKLIVGMKVQFHEALADDSLQAKQVKILENIPV